MSATVRARLNGCSELPVERFLSDVARSLYPDSTLLSRCFRSCVYPTPEEVPTLHDLLPTRLHRLTRLQVRYGTRITIPGMLLQQSILSAAADNRWAKEFHFECRKGDVTMIEVLHKLAPLSERARPVFAAMKWPTREQESDSREQESDSDTSDDGARFNKCGSCGMRSHRKKDCSHGND
ncbi:hypothetical protein GNI_193660, partial [Gregarina niphandrodes]